MRSCNFARWLLPAFLLLSITTQMAAQESVKATPVDANALIKQAESGDADAQYKLGRAYAKGEGVSKDDAAAVRWFSKAAEQGDAHAQLSLSLLYANGSGVAKDKEKADYWYRKSGFVAGVLIRKTQPKYPKQAKRNHIQGSVVVRGVIGKDGRFKDLTPISGPQELIQSAINAVQQWQYKPYELMGEPIEVDTQVTVNFALAQ